MFRRIFVGKLAVLPQIFKERKVDDFFGSHATYCPGIVEKTGKNDLQTEADR